MNRTWKRSGGRAKWIALLVLAMSLAVIAATAGHGGHGWGKGWGYGHHRYAPPCNNTCIPSYTPPPCCAPAPPSCCAVPADNDVATVTNNVSINQSSWVGTDGWNGYYGPWDGCNNTCNGGYPWWGYGWGGADVDVNQQAQVSINTNINQ